MSGSIGSTGVISSGLLGPLVMVFKEEGSQMMLQAWPILYARLSMSQCKSDDTMELRKWSTASITAGQPDGYLSDDLLFPAGNSCLLKRA